MSKLSYPLDELLMLADDIENKRELANPVFGSMYDHTRIREAHDEIIDLRKQRDELLAAVIKARNAWRMDHLSHDPLDILNEAIAKAGSE